MKLVAVAQGLTKKAAREMGMSLRRAGRVAFIYPSPTAPKKWDVMVPPAGMFNHSVG